MSWELVERGFSEPGDSSQPWVRSVIATKLSVVHAEAKERMDQNGDGSVQLAIVLKIQASSFRKAKAATVG
ncbi:hypothetical protein SRHO_G00150530 [Serrasalmus rhombeus]